MNKWFFSIGLFLLVLNAQAQRGFNFQAGAMGGLSFISPQNHYDNPTFELDYVNSIGFSGQAAIGYGFKRSFGLMAEVGYQQINQKYDGQFSPGFDLPNNQKHNKEVNLSYITTSFLVRYTPNLADDYVLDTKVQMHLVSGLQIGLLSGAKAEYTVDGNKVDFPVNFNPFVNTDFAYEGYPIETDAKAYFTKTNLSFVLQFGMDWFITEKLSLSPALRGHVSLLDINNKDYRIHDTYKASRVFYGGLYIGMCYFFSRG
jgi:hypothetical protein